VAGHCARVPGEGSFVYLPAVELLEGEAEGQFELVEIDALAQQTVACAHDCPEVGFLEEKKLRHFVCNFSQFVLHTANQQLVLAEHAD
jgi:hypothetical protein